MAISIVRSFVSRSFGDIGKVELTIPDGDWAIDGKKLPASSVMHLATFALQTLQDAYAGAKDAAEAKGAFDGKLDKLLAGTIGTRSGGGGVTERDKVARIIVGEWFRGVFTPENPEHPKVAAYKAGNQAERYAIIDAIWTDNEAIFAEDVDAEVAARKAKADKLAKLNGKVSL